MLDRKGGFMILALAGALVVGWITLLAWADPKPADPEKKEAAVSDSTHCKRLTPDEERVIVHKGTERAFSGAFWDFHEDGMYRCKRCSAALFPSSAKFDSGTGWPSFDDAVPGAVREVPDADGFRIEIVCAACGAHLGHVFKGEGFTRKEVRHCVNSVSLEFEPAGTAPNATPSTGTGVQR